MKYQVVSRAKELSDGLKDNTKGAEAATSETSSSSSGSPLPSTSRSISPAKPPSTSSSSHLPEAAGDAAGENVESDPTRDSVRKVDSDLDKKSVVETNGEEAGDGDEQSNAGDGKATKELDAGAQIEHEATQSVEDTVTITETESTEEQVCLVRWRVFELRINAGSHT